MLTHFWHCGILMIVMVGGAGGILMPPLAQAKDPLPTAQMKDQVPTFELDRIIGFALERNPMIASAQSVIEQNQGRRTQAGAYPNPAVTAQFADATVRTARTGARAVENGVIVEQTVEWPAMRAARKDAADAGLISATFNLDEAKLNLVAEVKGTFYDLLLAERTVDLLQLNLENVQDVARIVKARVRSGEGPQFELVKAEVEVLKAKQEVTKAKNVVRVKLVGLDTLTAGALGPRYEVQGDFRSLRGPLDPEQMAARDLSQHPILKRQEKLVEQAEFTVTKERKSLVPEVTLFGGYSTQVETKSIIAGVTVPVPVWYQKQGHIAEALGTQRKEEAGLVHALNNLSREINQHAREAQTAQERILVYEEGLLKQAQEALRIAQLSFRQGASSLLEVLDAQRVQRQITVDYNLARFELSLALTQYERALGGPL